MKSAAFKIIAGLIVWTLATVILVAPFWAIACFVELDWINPIASEPGRLGVGMAALIAGMLTTSVVLND